MSFLAWTRLDRTLLIVTALLLAAGTVLMALAFTVAAHPPPPVQAHGTVLAVSWREPPRPEAGPSRS